ncbi:hypothetical protein [Streptomyces malaysiensis]|uniref:hypothetical protein n=1 Tax=Streptomyces malaysiensis TaxID=92644 RepID=UPI002795C914|nr:hypothetical protein [Streptomyces samsunensis]
MPLTGHSLSYSTPARWTAFAGIVLGSSQGCRPEPLLRDVFRERLTPLGVPVAWELGFGHGPSSLTLPLGVPAELEVSTHRTVLTIRGGAA